MADQRISLEELANLNDGTKVDLEVIENDGNGAYNLVKDEITDFIAIQSNKNKPIAIGFYESLPNTDLRKSIENVLKNKNLKEVIMKKNAQSDFDAKMARIKKIKSKSFRKMKRKEKLKQAELKEENEDVTSSEDDNSEISEENIHEFKPVLEFKNNGNTEKEIEEPVNEIVNEAFEIPGFKGNEMDFLEEKKAIVFEDAPQTIEHSLPGWNSWAGDGIEFQKTRYNTVIEKKDGIKDTDRQDFTKKHIIINEHIEISDKYRAIRPYGYTGKDFNEKLATPISLETTSLKIFNRFVKMSNRENNVPGQSIEPKEFDPQY